MQAPEALALYLRYGSRLDGYATRITEKLAECLPKESAQMLREIVQPQEAHHARMQAEMAHRVCADVRMPNEVYTEVVGNMALTPDPLWNALWMNIGEQFFASQFKVLARKARDLGYREVYFGLCEIAKDEVRHYELGWENLPLLGTLTPEVVWNVANAMEVVNRSDQMVDCEIPKALGLPSLRGMAGRCAGKLLGRLL